MSAIVKQNQIPASIRALYRIIGRIIGRQIFDRVNNDTHISDDPEARRSYAQEVIETITVFRKQLLDEDRDFTEIEKTFTKLLKKDDQIAIKQLAWILEAYLLLNQSSTASAEVANPDAATSDRMLAGRLIDEIRTKILQEKNLAKVFTKDFSLNLVLTAHPTAGIQPDYVHHIKSLVSAVQRIAFSVDPSDWDRISQDVKNDSLESNVADIIADINLSVSHMVRAKPYNTNVLLPSDESNNFLENLAAAWDIIPSKIIALENELRKYLGKEFRIHSRFFRIHSWVARDIDGNPTVSSDEHLFSIFNEKMHFLSKYRRDLKDLWQNLSDDFTNHPDLPSKTFFVNQEFKQYYEQALEENPNTAHPNKAYRVVLSKIVDNIDASIDQILNLTNIDKVSLLKLTDFDIEEELIKPLELIRANKEGTLTREIDTLIRKAQIFGLYGSHGHTRQGAEVISKLVHYLTALWEGQVEPKTSFVLKPDQESINYPSLRQKIILQYKSDPVKVQKKLLQTFDLLELSEIGAIHRQIISMNTCFEDMLNVLVLAKVFGAFRPGGNGALPWSRLEIVPLTEQIVDLRNSYKVTIEALVSPVWGQYLMANRGRFYKMRGPSDSGKQNGFVASQWEMFRSKQFDTIVVEIFNAFLSKELFADDARLKQWQQIKSNSELTEFYVINEAFINFEQYFASENFDKTLWTQACKELDFKKVRLINFDGWGEPVERGGGLEFEDTVKCTQPNGSLPYYERTLQGGGAQQLSSSLRTKQAVQDFINGVTDIAVKRFALNKTYNCDAFMLDPNFVMMMDVFVKTIRTKLRSEVFGLDLEDDTKVENESVLRDYFRHVIKSPLVFLDLFNIASRPTSRSGAQIKEFLADPIYSNSVDLMVKRLPVDDIINILGDVRAIPYAAMFSLLGGNHVSFYGFDAVLESSDKFAATSGVSKRTLVEWITHYYHLNDGSQEHILTKHIIDSLEKGLLTADQNCYRKAHEIIELATDYEYNSSNDVLILKLLKAEKETINFVARVKNYQVGNSSKVKLSELMVDDAQYRDLLLARRNDAVVPRMGIAIAISKILDHAQRQNLNPLAEENIPNRLLDLLRKAFAAGASTFGNGCID